jgi:DNA-binding NarL/FixJ family response regulator
MTGAFAGVANQQLTPCKSTIGDEGRLLRVAVGDGSDLLRGAITYLLESDPDAELVASCADAATLIEAVSSERPDVVLLDIRLPPACEVGGGISVANRLRITHPEIGVVLVSRHDDSLHRLGLPDDGYERRALLLKRHLRDRERLIGALRAVAHDPRHYRRSAARR